MIYPFWELVVTPIYRLWLRKFKGTENIPRPPFIVAANHSSYYDTLLPHLLLIPLAQRKVHAMVNARFWNIPVARQVLNHGECIPLHLKDEPDAKEKNKLAFEFAMEYLKKGDIILMFPEGTRSPDGKLKKAHKGIARLALTAKVPVLPFGIINSHKVLPKGKVFPRFERCEVSIGKPIHFNKKINEKSLVEVTRKIMKDIAKLVGQDYNY